MVQGSHIFKIGLGWGGVCAWANIFEAFLGISMVYMLRGSKNGSIDVRGPPGHLLWKSVHVEGVK